MHVVLRRARRDAATLAQPRQRVAVLDLVSRFKQQAPASDGMLETKRESVAGSFVLGANAGGQVGEIVRCLDRDSERVAHRAAPLRAARSIAFAALGRSRKTPRSTSLAS